MAGRIVANTPTFLYNEHNANDYIRIINIAKKFKTDKLKKYSLQEINRANPQLAAKMLFPEMDDEYIRKTLCQPGKDEVKSLKYYIEDAKLNTKFNFTLVGSILDETTKSNDIDLVLHKKASASTKDLEEACIKIRLFGLQELFCDIDVFYRSISEMELEKRISEEKNFYTWRLNRPNQDYVIRKNNIKFKKIGKMIVVQRKPELQLWQPKAIKLNPYFKRLPKSKPFC